MKEETIDMKEETIEIGKLYDDLLKSGYKIIIKGDYEIITPDNIEILTNGPKYTKLVAISRHKTIKHIIRLIIKCNENISREIKITTDHVCMIFNKNNFFENIDAKNPDIEKISGFFYAMLQAGAKRAPFDPLGLR